jgi:putative phosphoesterase
MRIGLISDTHGLLRPEAESFLAGCDQIIHAGDIGTPEILEQLAQIAPVSAVRGNNDKGAWADELAETELVQLGQVLVYVIHDIARLGIDPPGAGVQVVVSGHSHRPKVQQRDGVLYINPGSAGRRRFKLPISIGELVIDGATVVPRLAKLALSMGHDATAFVRDV